jgi:hypothetical protein
MEKREVIIDMNKANVFAIVMFVAVGVVLCGLFRLIWGRWTDGESLMGDSIIILIGFIVAIVVHELIHGITWSFFAPRGLRGIKFGIMKKYYNPYCHCSDPLPRNGYLWGALMPGIVTGLIPAVVALAIGSFVLLVFSVIMISAASGDLMIALLALKEDPGCTIYDHPTEGGFYVEDQKES